MRKVKGLVAAGLLVSATGCVGVNGYPGTSMGYGGYPSGGYPGPSYGYAQPGYSSGGLFSSLFTQQPAYYQPAPQYYQAAPQYYPAPVASQPQYVPVQTSGSRPWSQRSSWGRRDSDGDSIPNRYDRDRNNDGIPDRQQRRGWSG